MHTQMVTAETILDAGGDYLTIKREIELVFETTTLACTVAQANSTTTHGLRIETRAIAVSDVMRGLSDWPGLH